MPYFYPFQALVVLKISTDCAILKKNNQVCIFDALKYIFCYREGAIGEMTMRTSKKRNGGFTLLEVLITVAILVIVLAFGIVGVVRYRDYLKITELDNLAREIYMAAENRAVLLQNSGAAKSRVEALSEYTVDGKKYRILTHAPAVPVTIASMAVPAAVDYSDELLPAGSIDPALREGHFRVLYYADTGHVAEVFYAEEGEIQTGWFDTLRKSRSQRVEAFRSDDVGTPTCLVGHYGGDVTVEDDMADSDVKILPAPGVEVLIVNGNELTLTVKFTIPGSIPTGSDAPVVTRIPSVKLKYEGKEIDLLDNASITTSRRKNEGNIDDDNTATYTWVLDSLVKDSSGNSQQFKDLFTSGGLAFGKDFTVTAGLTLSADGYIDGACYAKAEDNSLFAKGSTASDCTDTAFIANLRHLQNLHSGFSGVASSITKAEQTADIECKEYKNNQGASLVPNYEFTPILNSSLREYDGMEKEIRRLTTVESANAGLFQEIAKTDTTTTIHNVRLIAPDVKGISNAGGLVGEVKTACTFENCRVYWNTPEELVTGSDINYKVSGECAGGLIGCAATANITIKNSFAAATVKGGTVGGLIGKQNSATVKIENSYADCYLSGTSAAGGLIGDGSPTLSNCYAAGFIVEPGGSVNTAGLVGGNRTVTASRCYSVVRVLKTGGTLEKPVMPLYSGWKEDTVDGAYAVFYFSKAEDVTDQVKTLLDDAFEYENSEPETHAYNLRYEMSKTLSSADETLKLTSRYPFPGLAGVAGITFPHYDDWAELEKKADAFELVYYEEYEVENENERKYGLKFSKQFEEINFSDEDSNGNPLTDGKDGKVVKRDGYALAFKQNDLGSLQGQETTIGWECDGDTWRWTLKWDGDQWQWIKDGSGAEPESVTVITISDGGYSLIPLPVEMVYGDTVPIGNGDANKLKCNQKLAVKTGANEERIFYFNPHFVIEIQGPDANGNNPDRPADEGTEIKIRTPRHFYDLSRKYKASSKNVEYDYPKVGFINSYTAEFKQELDLDYAVYDGWLDAKGTAAQGKFFKQNSIQSGENFIYDGQCHRIRNVFVHDTAGNNGLFSKLSAGSELRNIVFEMDPTTSLPMGGSGSGAAGALLGSMEGSDSNNKAKVTNCAVYGVNINANMSNMSNIGGLVGDCGRNSIVERCSAEVACLAGKRDIGGLVGKLSVSSAELIDSYAVGYIQKTGDTGNVGGLVGNVGSNYAQIKRCYAAVRLEGGGTKYGLCNKGNVEDSYWLNGNFKYRGEYYSSDTYNNNNKGTPISYEEFLNLDKDKAFFTNMEKPINTIHYFVPEGTPWIGDYVDPTDLDKDRFLYFSGVKDKKGMSVHYGLWPVKQP